MKLCLIFLAVGALFTIGETSKSEGYDDTSDDIRSLEDEADPNDVNELPDEIRSLLDERKTDDVDDMENALRESDVDAMNVGDGNYAMTVKDADGNVKAWWVGPAVGLAKWGIRKIRWGRRRRRKGHKSRPGQKPRKRRVWDVNSIPISEDESDDEVSEKSLT